MARTDQEIVDQTNVLAHRMLAEGVGTGYVHDEGDDFKIYDHLENPRYAAAWNLACIAQELITQTDPNDALSAIEPAGAFYEVQLVETVNYTIRVHAADEDEAGQSAQESWTQSEDPHGQFEGVGHGVEVASIRKVEE